MTAQQRKDSTNQLLKQLGIPVNSNLPVIEEEQDIVIRNGEAIAKRIIILAYLGVYAEGGDKEEIISFFKAQQIWNSVSENEQSLFTKNKLTKKDKIKISWGAEAMYLLLWAINKVDSIDLPTDQVDTGALLDLLPEFLEPKLTNQFITTATVRPTHEILDQSDLIYRMHWAVRQAEIDDMDTPAEIDAGIIEEWHYAINWLTFYAEDWDEITTDT
jgi:hypothetical protein